MNFTNLFIGYNRTEDFKILICAFDKLEAAELAEAYRYDTGLDGVFEIYEPTDGIDHIHFDCDYVVA